MGYLLDTSILGRLANKSDHAHSTAVTAISKLHLGGEELFLIPQVLIEFRNFATRPTAINGLGLSPTQVDILAATFEGSFALLEETKDVFPAWKALVGGLNIIGKQVHDARLVASCHVHGVTHILTFNVSHFSRMGGFTPGVIVIDPASV